MTVSSSGRIRDWFLLLACNFIWASQFVLVKIVQMQMGPVAATFIPIGFATLLLFVIVRLKNSSAGNADRIPSRDVLQFLVIGVFGQVVAQLFITWGMRYAPASNAALLMLALPVSTAVMAFFFLGERMTLVRWISFAFAIGGVLECSGINWSQLNFSSKFLLGNFFIFVSVNGSAFYNAYSKRMLARYTPLQVLLYSYYSVLIFLFPITVFAEPNTVREVPQFTPAVWMGLLGLAVFVYLLSMVLFLTVLTRLDATQASLSNYLIPFFGVIIAAVALHERLTIYMVLGGLLVLASTLLITVYEGRKRARSESELVPNAS